MKSQPYNQIHGWRARRAGAAITITHATGKITNVAEVYSHDGMTLAMVKGEKPGDAGTIYELL